MNTRIHIAAGVLLLAFTPSPGLLAQPVQPTFFHVTPSPSRPVVLPGGSLLIGVRALAPNTGSVVFLDSDGDEAGILRGLPYAGANAYRPGELNGDGVVDVVDVFKLVNFLFAQGPAPLPTPLEPDGMVARGSSLYIATGELVPALQSPSPNRSAVLRITFSSGLGFHEAFVLRSEDVATLLHTGTVVLTHTANDTATVKLLVNGVPVISDLMVDETTGRLYILSRAENSLSFIPLQ